MKKHLLLLLSIFSATYLYAQKIEVTVQANSGLFSYAGKSTTGSSVIMQTSDDKNSYTNNPYGNKKTMSYGFDIQTQFVAKCGFILGLQTGYDILRSKTTITAVYPYIFYIPFINSANYILVPYPAKGATYLQNRFINLNPYIGYRFSLRKIKLDVLPGLDIAFKQRSYDKGKAITSDGTTYYTDLKMPDMPADIRLKLGLAASYNRFGITGSYAYGLTNYEKNVVEDASYNTKSRLVRFGISYRIF